ncbi:MAG: hypothetical protein Q9M22_04130 [Mariprofundaceae bacterium]|nr:hypothetical protein [Mariprofundaceae bacterium]
MMDINISNWILNPNIWFIVGSLVLVVGMMLDGMDVALLLGVPALIIAFLIAVFPTFLQTWVAISLVYVVIVVIGFVLLMRFKNNIVGDYDVNDE